MGPASARLRHAAQQCTSPCCVVCTSAHLACASGNSNGKPRREIGQGVCHRSEPLALQSRSSRLAGKPDTRTGCSSMYWRFTQVAVSSDFCAAHGVVSTLHQAGRGEFGCYCGLHNIPLLARHRCYGPPMTSLLDADSDGPAQSWLSVPPFLVRTLFEPSALIAPLSHLTRSKAFHEWSGPVQPFFRSLSKFLKAIDFGIRQTCFPLRFFEITRKLGQERSGIK